MSVKKLQRTVIEGGRASRSKWDRRNSHSLERTSEREFCHRAVIDPESVDNIFINEKKPVYKEFSDKLSPMYRWLHSQVGNFWNDIYSEISKKFDVRTTAGRHILFDHLLNSVEITPNHRRYYYNPDDPTASHYRHDFYVDDEGILKEKRYIPRNQNKIPKFNTESIANWLHGCVIGKVGNKFFWFVPVDKSKKYGGYNFKWKTEWKSNYYYNLTFLHLRHAPIYVKNKEGVTEIIGYEPVWKASYPNFRQDRKLNDKEMIFWNSMPEWYQNKILERSPVYPENLKSNYKDYRYYY